MPYPNGAIPDSALMEVEPGIRLLPGVGTHYKRAVAAYEAKTGHDAWSSEGFRPLGSPGDWPSHPNTQWYYYERKRAIPSSPSAATPGQSMHGWGKATDIHSGSYNNNSGGALYTTLKACMEAEGFVCDIAGEPWHFNYYGSDADFAGENAIPITEEWDEMATEAQVEAAAQRGATSALAAAKNDWMNTIGGAIDNTRLSLENTARQQTMDMLHAIGSAINAGDSQVIGTVNDALGSILEKLKAEQADGLAAAEAAKTAAAS